MIAKLVFLAAIAAVIYLVVFNKPRHHSVEELQTWFDTRLDAIAGELDRDIELDKQGQYPHAGMQSFERRGAITYPLVDKHYARFDISQQNSLTPDDIRATAAWQRLSDKVESMQLELKLDEVKIEGDEVDDDFSLDEYIDDVQRYYTVTVSGW